MAGDRVRPACGTRCRGSRADAVRNHGRILAAARDLFAQEGSHVSLDRIARLAGVSNATLYRHYDGRQELLADVANSIADAVLAAESQVPGSDPFVVFRGFLGVLARERPAALFCLPDQIADSARARVVAATRRQLGRVQRAGRVRDDVTAGEVLAVVAQLGRPLPGVSWQAADEMGPRLLQLFADGLAVAGRAGRSPAAPMAGP
ncbi:helix-turn-helix domain containing protein [Streptomyces sp. AK02-01A]|nr:helix-turn-helix domain containing protein [Streptomyces sp. AK02-01A]